MHLLLLAMLSARAGVIDPGRPDDGRGPVALLVQSPGLSPRATAGLVEALEARGIDALQLRLPPAEQDLERILEDAIPAALLPLEDRPAVLVGEGLGGTFCAMALARMPAPARPEALALLGAPLQIVPQRLYRWLAGLPRPAGGIDLRALAGRQPRWNDQPVVPLILGEDPPELGWLSSTLAATLLAWGTEGHRVDLSPLAELPVWAAAGAADVLAPPESVRPALQPEHRFIRYGLDGMIGEEYDHADLLRERRPSADLAAWASRVLSRSRRD